MTTYQIMVQIEKDIPLDILQEHIVAALKQFRTEPVPASEPVVTVRQLLNGGIVSGNSTHRDSNGNFVAPPKNGDKIVYDLHGPTENFLTQEQVKRIGADALAKMVEYTKQLPKLYDNFNGAQGRQHPFDGPEMFDDVITAETITSTPQNVEGEMLPKTAELLRDLLRREDEGWKVQGEGEWQIDPNEGDKVGDDIE